MNSNNFCIICGSKNILKKIEFDECLNCQGRFDLASSMIHYEEIYSDENSLYSEHLKSLDIFQNSKKIHKFLLPYEKKIINVIKKNRIISLVDLGCGTGRLIKAVQEYVNDINCFEISNVLLRKLSAYGWNCHRGGVKEYLESSVNGEAVTLCEVVEHVQNPGELIRKIYTQKTPKFLFLF